MDIILSYLFGFSTYTYIGLGLLAVILAIMVYMGVFKSVEITSTSFQPKVFVYRDIQSKMSNLGKHFEILANE